MNITEGVSASSLRQFQHTISIYFFRHRFTYLISVASFVWLKVCLPARLFVGSRVMARKRKKREHLEEAQQVQQPEKSWEEKQKHREEAIRSVKRSPEYTLLSNLRQTGALPLDGAATPDPTDPSIPKRRWETIIQSWRRDMRDAAEKVKVMPGLFNIYLRRRAFDDMEIERQSSFRSSYLNGLPWPRRRAATANPRARNQAAGLSRNTDDIAQTKIVPAEI